MSLAIAQRFVLVLEGRDRDDRAEDLLLEDAHLVVALEDGRLARSSRPPARRRDVARSPPVSTLRAFLLADVDVGQDLLELVVGGLRADHGRRDRAGCPA